MNLAFLPNGRRFATVGLDGLVKLWDTETGQNVFTFPQQTEALFALAISPDGTKLAVGGMEGAVPVFELPEIVP